MNNKLINEVYFSVDCEFDGPIPPTHSMLSFGSVAFTLQDGIIGEKEYNLKTLPGATMHTDNKKFWDRNPKAYEATLVNPWEPFDAMKDYAAHIEEMTKKKHKPILIEYPGGCDYSWVHWYFHRHIGYCPFGHSSHNMKSYAAAMLKCAFRDSAKGQYPKHWFNRNLKHTHKALDDARSQGDMFIRMLCEHNDIPLPKGMK